MRLICTQCGRSFEGLGSRCPECARQRKQEREEEYSTPGFALRKMLRVEDEDLIRPAGKHIRSLAYLVDRIIIALLWTGVALAAFPLSGVSVGMLLGTFSSQEAQVAGMTNPAVWISGALLLWAGITLLGGLTAQLLYYVAFESSSFRGTPGKLILGLEVTDINGARISWSRALARYVGRALYIFLWLAAIPLWLVFPRVFWWLFVFLCSLTSAISLVTYAMMSWTDMRQGIHDLVSGCVVQDRTVVGAGRILLVCFFIFVLPAVALLLLTGKIPNPWVP